MKLTKDTSVIDGNILRMKLGFTLVMFISLHSDPNLKLENGLDWFINNLNLYLQRMMGTLDVKGFTVGIKVSGVKMEQPSGMVIRASDGFTALLSV